MTVLDEEIKNKILSFIRDHPGTTLFDIIEFVDVRYSVIQQHLDQLKHSGSIRSEDQGIDTRFYYVTPSRIPERTGRNADQLREHMLSIIENNPGLHLSKIADMMEMSIQLAEYHLNYLEKKNLISSIASEGGKYKRFFTKSSNVGAKEKELVSLLREPSLLKIVLLLWKKPYIRHKDLLRHLDIAPSTLTHHLNHLIDLDIVSVQSHGKKKGYHLLGGHEIIKIIKKNELNKILDDFKDLWDEISFSS
jgi:predicted transcriptional regulator